MESLRAALDRLTEAGYDCMAQYIAHNITVGLFAKPRKTPPKSAD